MANQKDQPIGVQSFRDLVESRRSVRQFKRGRIPKSVTKECLRLAMLAPNSSNLQPWHFYWVQNPQKKKQLVTACLDQNAAKTASELIVIVARTDTWKKHAQGILDQWPDKSMPPIVERYYKKMVPMMYDSGFMGISGQLKKAYASIRGIYKPTPRGPYTADAMRLWAVKSTSLASAHLMLAYRSFGYDTCPMEGFDARLVSQIVEPPKGAEIVMVLAVGSRATKGVYNKRFRFPREEFVSVL